MYHEVCPLQVVTNTIAEFSQAVDMADGNAVLLDVVLVVLPASSTLRVTIQYGNDLQNWENGDTLSLTAVGFDSVRSTQIAGRFVRLKMDFSAGTGTAILRAGINIAKL
jgi:hypothetical protein